MQVRGTAVWKCVLCLSDYPGSKIMLLVVAVIGQSAIQKPCKAIQCVPVCAKSNTIPTNVYTILSNCLQFSLLTHPVACDGQKL